jgi:hypothetical protein
MKKIVIVAALLLAGMAAPAFGQVAQLQQPPDTTVPTQCIDLNQDRVCEAVVLANGTMINFTKLAPTPTPTPEKKVVLPPWCEGLTLSRSPPPGPSSATQTAENGTTTWTDPKTGLVYDIPTQGDYCLDFDGDSACDIDFTDGKQVVYDETDEAETPTEGMPTKLVDNCTMPDPKTQCFVQVMDNGTLVIVNGKPSYQEPQALPGATNEDNLEVETDLGETDEEFIEEDAVGETDSIEEEDESDSEYCDDNDNDGYCDDDPSICIDDDENDVCDVDEVPTMPDTSPTNDWMNACSTIQQFLYQSCDAYVNSDGTLTDEGDRALVCIRNGAVLGGGGMIGGVPPSIAADILGGLAEMTGCGGIVDMQELKQMVSLGRLTDLSALSRFLP